MDRQGSARFDQEVLWGAWSRFVQVFDTNARAGSRPGTASPAPATTHGAAPRVLVAEDNPSLQVLTCRTLAGIGVTSVLAVDGAEAVALATAADFDLILMDLQMPVLDGFGATRRIRLHEREHARPRVPVVAYTAWPYNPNEPFLLDFGIDAVLHKPCTTQALKECLVKWISPRRGVELFVAAGPDTPKPAA